MKKVWSIVLVCALLAGLFGVASFAADDPSYSKAVPLISQLQDGPTETIVQMADENGGVSFTQSGGWLAWVMYYTQAAMEFEPNAGEKLYVLYDLTIPEYSDVQITLNGWNNAISKQIAGTNFGRADGGSAYTILAGTYRGAVEVTKDMIGEDGRVGIVGDGITIREFKLVSAAENPVPVETSTEPTESSEPTSEPESVLNGDANEDGSVDMKDVLVIRKHVAHMDVTMNETAADVNSDGSIDMKDVLAVRKHIANIEPLPTKPTSAPTEPTTTTTTQAPTTTTTHKEGAPIIEADGSFFDDFSTGIDQNLWYISKQAWGGATNGELVENVNYTEDGQLVLTAHGDLYKGMIGTKNGSRTGGCLLTKHSVGPGSYEVKMKVLPRMGTCSAMWTYFNDGPRNHEIDIEIPGNTETMKYSLFTNWLATYNNLSQNTIPDFYHNDGEWHTYRFDWHTNPARIDYYVDGNLEISTNQKVPTAGGHFWVGVWIPADWCGVADFETAHMLVDYVRYTAYDEEYEVTDAAYRYGARPEEYPTAPIKLPTNNYVANGSFDNDLFAWDTTGAASIVSGADGKAIQLGDGASASQKISSIGGKMTYRITADGLAAGEKATLTVESLDSRGTRTLDTKTLEFTGAELATKSLDITTPDGTAFLRLTLHGAGTFDKLYLTQPNRGDF